MRELKCLRCGTMMEFHGEKTFQLGDASTIMGDWAHILAGAIIYEVYECPECGKAELYRPQNVSHDRKPENVAVEKTDRSKLKDRRFGF